MSGLLLFSTSYCHIPHTPLHVSLHFGLIDLKEEPAALLFLSSCFLMYFLFVLLFLFFLVEADLFFNEADPAGFSSPAP